MAAIHECKPLRVSFAEIVSALSEFVARPRAEQLVRDAIERMDRAKLIDIDDGGYITHAKNRYGAMIPNLYRGLFLVGREGAR